MRKIVKKATFIVMAGLIAAGIFSGCGTTEKKSEGKKEYKIGVVQLVQHAALDAANKGFVDGLASKGFKDNIVLDQQNAQADQSNLNTITQRFVTNKVVLIVGSMVVIRSTCSFMGFISVVPVTLEPGALLLFTSFAAS